MRDSRPVVDEASPSAMTDLAPLTPQPPATSFLARLEGGPLDGLALTVGEASLQIEFPAPPPRATYRGGGADDAATVIASYALAPSADRGDPQELRYVFLRCRRAPAA
jgi:hypothetical protein